MIDAFLQSVESVLSYLESRPGIWVVLVGLLAGIGTGMVYKKAVVRLVQAVTGLQEMSPRCADAHAVLIQLLSGAVAFAAVVTLWPYEPNGRWVVALCVALSCGIVYDVIRALIAWRWPAFARRLGLPRGEA